LSAFVADQSLAVLFGIIAICIIALGKGADWLVDEAVALSLAWGMPQVLVGATVVSLGTTLPEAAVSVLAAIEGEPGLALGNAVGSIICDTGLILGLSAVLAPLPLERQIVNRQGWLQLGAGFLLVVACIPLGQELKLFQDGGHLPQAVGWLFLTLLGGYMWLSVRWARLAVCCDVPDALATDSPRWADARWGVLGRLMLGMALVVGSSHVLIPTVEETALRIGVPDSIVAATLVAFGTSLPELVTALTAVRKGCGQLAVGNVIGADILNVLFVAGAAAAVTPGGLAAPAHFFQFLFPAMLLILVVFRLGIFFSGAALKRPFGLLLLAIYLLVMIVSYTDALH
jgi:cation:H+ antiporter